MEKNNVIDTNEYNGERVTSNYVELYFDDKYSDEKPKTATIVVKNVVPTTSRIDTQVQNEWISPSDLLIGKIELRPPFTSRITRGITHDGILKIGQGELDKERSKFLKRLNKLLSENEAAWEQIQQEEKKTIATKVRVLYNRILNNKCSKIQKEMSWFYENTLLDLESHLRCEVRTALMTVHCKIISELNTAIEKKLQYEKGILQEELKKKYERKVRKMTKYYKLLLHNEKYRCNQLVNEAIEQRNAALKSFCRQIEAEATTSTMYVMSMERKKCRMRQFILENSNTDEIKAKVKEMEEKAAVLEDYKKGKKDLLDINNEWEEKAEKILRLFLKFLSYSLKLLPEQTTFLVDLEKVLVLQLNEIQKHPETTPSILIDEDDLMNIEFIESEKPKTPCEKEPFVIEGKMTPSVSTVYGSQESIPINKKLPYFRLQRQFIYAKCQKVQEVKDFLESIRCPCRDQHEIKEPSVDEPSSPEPEKPSLPEVSPISSTEPFIVDDTQHLGHCPAAACQDYVNRLSFPNLDDYLDYNEEKFARVQAILGRPAKLKPAPAVIYPIDLVGRELPFAATNEPHRNQETQYSSCADLPRDIQCPCGEHTIQGTMVSHVNINVNEILRRRKESLKKIMHENPKLMQLLSDADYDNFIY